MSARYVPVEGWWWCPELHCPADEHQCAHADEHVPLFVQEEEEEWPRAPFSSAGSVPTTCTASAPTTGARQAPTSAARWRAALVGCDPLDETVCGWCRRVWEATHK